MKIRCFNHQLDRNKLQVLNHALKGLHGRIESILIYFCVKATKDEARPKREIHLIAKTVDGKDISLTESNGEKATALFSLIWRLRSLFKNTASQSADSAGRLTMTNTRTTTTTWRRQHASQP